MTLETLLIVFFTRNKRRSAPRRFFRRCGCPSRPESYSAGTHKEHRDRVIWLTPPTDVQAESLLLLLPCAQRRGAHSPHAATRPCSTLAALAASAMRAFVAFQNLAGSGISFTMTLAAVSAASNEIYLPCSMTVPILVPSRLTVAVLMLDIETK